MEGATQGQSTTATLLGKSIFISSIPSQAIHHPADFHHYSNSNDGHDEDDGLGPYHFATECVQ